jgi:hypothetical protein
VCKTTEIWLYHNDLQTLNKQVKAGSEENAGWVRSCLPLTKSKESSSTTHRKRGEKKIEEYDGLLREILLLERVPTNGFGRQVFGSKC